VNLKTKLAVATAGLLAVGGSAFGISLTTGVASAGPSPASSTEVTTPGDPGPAVQAGPQSGPDTAAPDAADAGSTETSQPESGAPTDGPGGHQDPAGTVDHQSSTEQ
jgi:hypothetical protein